MTPDYNIRPVSLDEPIEKGEIELTSEEVNRLQPMNRAERRAWARQNKHRRAK
jgi:hypothetical protein